MAIAIPALVDAQITALRATLESKAGAQNTDSVNDLYARGNRIADLMRLLTNLIDSGTLTATAGTATSVTDAGAFTGVNSLVGCTVTFAGNVTAALAGTTAKVITNTVNTLTFTAPLAGTPAAGDTFTLAFDVVDDKLDAVTGSKGMGSSASDVYGYGPSLMGAINVMVVQLGGTLPAWAVATPFTIGSPHAGGGTLGHGGTAKLSFLLDLVRDTVAAYTAPAQI